MTPDIVWYLTDCLENGAIWNGSILFDCQNLSQILVKLSIEELFWNQPHEVSKTVPSCSAKICWDFDSWRVGFYFEIVWFFCKCKGILPNLYQSWHRHLLFHLYLMGHMLDCPHVINTQVSWEVVRKYWLTHISPHGWVRLKMKEKHQQMNITCCWSHLQSTSQGCIQDGGWGFTTTSLRMMRCSPTCVTSTVTILMWTLVTWGNIPQREIFRIDSQLEWCGGFWYWMKQWKEIIYWVFLIFSLLVIQQWGNFFPEI